MFEQMSWHLSNRLIQDYENSHSLLEPEAAFSEACSLDGAPSAPWRSMPTALDDSCSGRMKGTCHRSLHDKSKAILFDESSCTATDDSWVLAHDRAAVKAYGRSTVIVRSKNVIVEKLSGDVTIIDETGKG